MSITIPRHYDVEASGERLHEGKHEPWTLKLTVAEPDLNALFSVLRLNGVGTLRVAEMGAPTSGWTMNTAPKRRKR